MALADASKKGRAIKSAYDSETFDADGHIHIDGLVGSATISPAGRDIALASPDGLAIIDLDSPLTPPRRLSTHSLPWLVVDVQWSPFAAREYWVASTANHRCLIWNLNKREDSASGAIEHSLHGHSRAITDINFSAHHPDFLATCSVDGYVHSWDLRRPRQPVLTFCDWLAGATQVKYNRQNRNVLASSHDRWLHIWDERNPSKPLKTFDAHTSKIYGLDWNRTRSTCFATCSLDKTVKLWDYGISDEPQRIIQTDYPVWRARHTPFGEGILAMPQNEPGNLYLYDTRKGKGKTREDGVEDPATIFDGHGAHKAKEFLWRYRGGISDEGVDDREFQLVSWGEDNELRLHRVNSSVLSRVGYTKGGPAEKNMNITRKGAAYKTFRSVEDSTQREKGAATMSDPRPDKGCAPYRQSALTAGSQTMSPHYPRSGGIASWRSPSMKAKSNGERGHKSLDQLGWMKGVTMSKKTSRPIGPPQRKGSRDSSMFGGNFDHWAEPETLQEEVLRVSQQLPNVKWENVDMNALTLEASLKGPWGVDSDTIYIEVKVDIPSNYPISKAPRFSIEKTALMPDQTYRTLEQHVNQVANQCSRRKQNCLEVVFSYLLGERDLSSSQTFFKNVRDLDDVDALADESSSDDDDVDIPPGGSASMSQELTASVELDATLAPANRGTVPPLPRPCGARWSNDGRLVCFFPSPEEKARALLFTPTDNPKERSKGEPTFAGFGRLQQDSPPPRQRHLMDETSMLDDHSDSGDEEDASSSSSDSDTAYTHKVDMWHLPARGFRKAFSNTYSIRSSGGGTGADTGTGTAASRRRPNRAKTIVSIHNLNDLLPSQKEFAEEYAIFGEGADVCEHNAKVAEKYGRLEIMHVWRYAALLLRKDIPLELLERGQQQDPILVIAKDLPRSGENMLSSTHESENNTLSGRVKWGTHPLAKELISELFDYFEKLSDVQMLAMLSCVFSEASAENGMAYAESSLSQPETPLPMKTPAFSLDYFPTDASTWHLHSNSKSQAASAISTPKTVHTPHISGSFGSEGGFWPGEPTSNSYSCGETPPPARTPRDTVSEGVLTPNPSTSPEHRLLGRLNNNLATGFAAGLPRPLTSAASASPPSRKRPSPGENFLANFAPSNITWGASTIMGPTSEPMTSRTSLDDGLNKSDPPLVCYDISVEMEDQSIFDDDGWHSVPLLEPSRNLAYASYRSAYAELLHMWGQTLSRLEILKFDVLKEGMADPLPLGTVVKENLRDIYGNNNDTLTRAQASPHGAASPILLGKKDELHNTVTSDRGLDVTGICHVHETQLNPIRSSQVTGRLGGAVGSCDRCKRTQTLLMCVYCREPIYGLYVPCLNCGCVFHDACLAEWHSMGESECPAGDECDCIEDAFDAKVESWAALVGALRHSSRGRGASVDLGEVATSPTSFGRDHEWESVASGSQLPAAGQGKPFSSSSSLHEQQQRPLTAARISISNRLRQSTGAWGSSTSLRRKSLGATLGVKR